MTSIQGQGNIPQGMNPADFTALVEKLQVSGNMTKDQAIVTAQHLKSTLSQFKGDVARTGNVQSNSPPLPSPKISGALADAVSSLAGNKWMGKSAQTTFFIVFQEFADQVRKQKLFEGTVLSPRITAMIWDTAKEIVSKIKAAAQEEATQYIVAAVMSGLNLAVSVVSFVGSMGSIKSAKKEAQAEIGPAPKKPAILDTEFKAKSTPQGSEVKAGQHRKGGEAFHKQKQAAEKQHKTDMEAYNTKLHNRTDAILNSKTQFFSHIGQMGQAASGIGDNIAKAVTTIRKADFEAQRSILETMKTMAEQWKKDAEADEQKGSQLISDLFSKLAEMSAAHARNPMGRA